MAVARHGDLWGDTIGNGTNISMRRSTYRTGLGESHLSHTRHNGGRQRWATKVGDNGGRQRLNTSEDG